MKKALNLFALIALFSIAVFADVPRPDNSKNQKPPPCIFISVSLKLKH